MLLYAAFQVFRGREVPSDLSERPFQYNVSCQLECSPSDDTTNQSLTLEEVGEKRKVEATSQPETILGQIKVQNS